MSERDRVHEVPKSVLLTQDPDTCCPWGGLDIETSGSSVSEEGREVSGQGLLYIEAAFLNVRVQFLRQIKQLYQWCVSLLEFIQSRYVYVEVRSHDRDYWPSTMASHEVTDAKALKGLWRSLSKSSVEPKLGP